MGNKNAKGKKGASGTPSRPSGGNTGVAGLVSGGGGVSGGVSGAGGNVPVYPGSGSGSAIQKLSDSDYAFLTSQTGQSKDEIKKIFDAFMANNPDGRLDRREFVTLYTKLRPENPDQLDEISQFVYRAFDQDKSGYIDFNEFMIAYSLTSRGDLKRKLEYAFALYDADGNGYLDKNELKEVISGMLDLLGADRRSHNATQLADEVSRELDTSRDGKVTKNEFIEGLMKNYSMRSLLSPFN